MKTRRCLPIGFSGLMCCSAAFRKSVAVLDFVRSIDAGFASLRAHRTVFYRCQPASRSAPCVLEVTDHVRSGGWVVLTASISGAVVLDREGRSPHGRSCSRLEWSSTPDRRYLAQRLPMVATAGAVNGINHDIVSSG